ncbi:alpha/beta fold hydrolase [Thioalkalivibrio sulfidiphilus]|nr:alpha/beta hydrolase [Thioalkalivibrio sulfidiphilus]
MAEREIGSHFVSVAGTELAYTVEGVGTPLLIVGSSIYYPRTFSQGLRRSCSLVCADLPHFVRLDSKFIHTSINFDTYAMCIEAIRLAAGLERVAVVGHSHHGNVALEYAKRFPQNVSHVVLICSPPVNIAQTVHAAEQYWALHASEERREALEMRRSSLVDKDQLESLSPADAYVRQYVADAPLYWNDPNYDASWLWDGMAFDMEAIRAFRDLYQEYELNWDAESLIAPVLIVMGEHDYAVPHTLWNRVLPSLENVAFRVFSKSGHTPQLEQPEEFDHLILDWITANNRLPLA